jgi:hypothetical protein
MRHEIAESRGARRIARAAVVAALAAVMATGCVVAPRSAYKAEKVTVCHKDKKTLVIPSSALSAHLGHGDERGPCE